MSTSDNTTNGPDIPAPPRRRRGLIISVIAGAVVVVVGAIAIITTVGNNNANAAGTSASASSSDFVLTGTKGTEADPVKIGVVGASDAYWTTYTQAAKAAGISIKIVNYDDYTQANPALAAGDIDLNQFQHIIFLADYNVKNNQDLQPIGATAIYPLGLYSQKYTSTADIPAGSTVAIPDDTTNLARGLLVLQSAGLVTLKDGGSPYATIDDIDTANSKVTVKTLDASLTANALPDVAAAIINNDWASKAGIKFSSAIAKDDPSDATAVPYVNIFVSRAADKDNATYLKLVQIYQTTQAVLDGVQTASGGTAVFATTSAADLQASLADLETKLKASN